MYLAGRHVEKSGLELKILCRSAFLMPKAVKFLQILYTRRQVSLHADLATTV